MRCLKISYILPDFDENAYSGGLYVIFEHCNGLQRRGHTIRVFNNTGKKSRYLKLDCDVERHKNDPAIVESNSPHIIVGTHWCTYFFVNRMKDILKNNTKLCFLMQSNERFVVDDEGRALVIKSMIGKYRDIIPIHRIAISKYLQDVLKQDLGQDSIYIKNGFETREVTPLLDKADKIRIVARYDPSTFRGWDLTNQVLERISRERDDIEIHLFEMKKKKPTKYKSFFHKGLVGRELSRLFKSCDIYLASSKYEGFSYPIIEAMSQGCSICCTDAGGNREFCIDGETALLCARGDREALYDNLKRLINDKSLRNRLSVNALNKVKEFKWEDAVDKLEDFFQSISNEKYDNRFRAAAKEHDYSNTKREKIFFIYHKDPFAKYRDWIKVDETMKSFKNAGFSIEAFLFVDKHSAKAVKGRLKMLLPPDDFASVKWKIFYNKRIKIQFTALNRWVFLIYSSLKISVRKINLKKKERMSVVYAEEQNSFLKCACKLLKISFYTLDFNNRDLNSYIFESYTKDFLQKEEEFKKSVRKIIDETFQNAA